MNCANAPCQTETMYFRSGSLHCIDCGGENGGKASGSERRMIWLCPECSPQMSVETWRPAGEQLRPKRKPLAVPAMRESLVVG